MAFFGFFPLQTTSRQAFGKPLAAQGTIQADVALSRMEIEQTRLLVLKAAHMMDLYGNKVKLERVGGCTRLVSVVVFCIFLRL